MTNFSSQFGSLVFGANYLVEGLSLNRHVLVAGSVEARAVGGA